VKDRESQPRIGAVALPAFDLLAKELFMSQMRRPETMKMEFANG
jgi:hypothetical protein